jgi:hypothetical protein
MLQLSSRSGAPLCRARTPSASAVPPARSARPPVASLRSRTCVSSRCSCAPCRQARVGGNHNLRHQDGQAKPEASSPSLPTRSRLSQEPPSDVDGRDAHCPEQRQPCGGVPAGGRVVKGAPRQVPLVGEGTNTSVPGAIPDRCRV